MTTDNDDQKHGVNNDNNNNNNNINGDLTQQSNIKIQQSSGSRSRNCMSIHGKMITDNNPSQHDALNKTNQYHTPSRNKYKEFFPMILYNLLMESKYNKIIDWSSDGNSFIIYDTEQFESIVMSDYFPKCASFKSFQRQVRRYHFNAVDERPPSSTKRSTNKQQRHIDHHYLRHEKFKRGKEELCIQLCKEKGQRTTTNNQRSIINNNFDLWQPPRITIPNQINARFNYMRNIERSNINNNNNNSSHQNNNGQEQEQDHTTAAIDNTNDGGR